MPLLPSVPIRGRSVSCVRSHDDLLECREENKKKNKRRLQTQIDLPRPVRGSSFARSAVTTSFACSGSWEVRFVHPSTYMRRNAKERSALVKRKEVINDEPTNNIYAMIDKICDIQATSNR